MQTRTPDLLDALIDHALGIQFTDLPTQTVHRVTQRLLDSVGAGLAGHQADDAATLRQAVTAWGDGGQAHVLGTDQKLPAASAAFLNAVLIRSFDFEPVEADGPGGKTVAAHISGTTVPVVLALGESTGASGAEVITALAVGDDLTARLAVAGGFDVYSGQDNTGTVNAIGASLIASRMLGLDHETTRHAVGIALNQAAGTVAAIFDGENGFKLPIAFAARAGITAVQLAQAGIRGPKDPLTGKHGYFEVFTTDPEPAFAVQGLGESFHGDCTIKPFASCRAAQPSLQACAELVTEHSVSAQEIECLTVHVTERTLSGFVGARFGEGDTRTTAALFSIHLTAAVALLHGTVRPEHLTAQALADPRLPPLLGRIEIAGTLPNNQRLTAEVTARLKDGSIKHVRVEHPNGNILRTALTEEAVDEKFTRNLGFGTPQLTERSDALRQQLKNLCAAPNLSELFETLDPTKNFTLIRQEQYS
ncbi:MmgE/PrpD family protein [Glutamicibacter arilaitensis]|uniref:MmgE/PrpD family protein n=1 Tax=Glutamicibacter arilaitensis TaxID=256701 RepID=UPI0038514330